jgi:hypothetical protein
LILLTSGSGELDLDDRSLFVPVILTAELVGAIFDCEPLRVVLAWSNRRFGGGQTRAVSDEGSLTIAQQDSL